MALSYRGIATFIKHLTTDDPQLHEALERVDTSLTEAYKYLNKLLFPDAVPEYVARVFHSANQAITTSTSTYLAFDSELYDLADLHDVSVNNSRFTIIKGGVYHFGACVQWDTGVTGFRQIALQVNRTTTIIVTRDDAIDTAVQNINCDYRLDPGDYVEVVVFHTQGANQNVVANTHISPEFWTHRVGD